MESDPFTNAKSKETKPLSDDETEKDNSFVLSCNNSFCSNDTIDYQDHEESSVLCHDESKKKNYNVNNNNDAYYKNQKEKKFNAEIFDRVNSIEHNDYLIFKGNKLDISILEFIKKIVFDFKPANSTIILAFIYLDFFLNKTKITLNKENCKK